MQQQLEIGKFRFAGCRRSRAIWGGSRWVTPRLSSPGLRPLALGRLCPALAVAWPSLRALPAAHGDSPQALAVPPPVIPKGDGHLTQGCWGAAAPEGARAEPLWVREHWLSLGVKPVASQDLGVTCRDFLSPEGHQSAGSSREDQAHEGGLRGGRSGDSGTAMGKIFQGTYGNWMPTVLFFFFLQSPRVSLGILVMNSTAVTRWLGGGRGIPWADAPSAGGGRAALLGVWGPEPRSRSPSHVRVGVAH